MAQFILWAAVGFIGLDVLTAIFWNKRYVERDASTRAMTVLLSGGWPSSSPSSRQASSARP